jgi:hypothetical protein
MWINPDTLQIDVSRFCPPGWAPLRDEPPPTVRITEVAVRDMPALVDGVWRHGWRIEPRNLDAARADVLAAINAARDRKEAEGFGFLGKWLQSDERSAARIANAALTASTSLATGQSFSVSWAAGDNTTIMLDAAGMLAMQAALTQRAASLHYYSRGLKDQVQAAATIDELTAVDIDTGWPA